MEKKWILVSLTLVVIVVGFVVYYLTRPLNTAGMSPDAVARAFFDALSNGDVNTLRCYVPKPGMFEEPDIRPRLLGLEIISIGVPFQKSTIPDKSQWFVPYQVRLKSGQVAKGELGLVNDPVRREWVFNGGF